MDSKIFDVIVEKFAYGGECFGRLDDGRAVFVPFSLPGEKVRIELIEEKKGFARAKLIEILEPSTNRIEPFCQHFTECGGCHYQHMSYEEQLKTKQQIVEDAFIRIGNFESIPILSIIPSKNQKYYRNTIQMHPTWDGHLGYQTWRTNEIIETKECFLPMPAIDDLWRNLQIPEEEPINRVSFKQNNYSDSMLVLESENSDIPEFSADLPISVVYIHPKGGRVLSGNNYLIYEVLDQIFQVTADSFFQVNFSGAENMVKAVLDIVKDTFFERKDLTIIDVYCGVGLFSKFLAPYSKELIGIELSESSCEDFSVNLDEFENVSIYQDKAERALPNIELQPDLIIVDPPRAGLGKYALESIIKKAPQVLIYISCDPSTLARDVRKLVDAGFVLESVTPLDMFPHTYHIENIVVLKR